MFQKNDLIFYGNAGVCRVESIGAPPKDYPVGEGKLYYKLVPLYEAGEIYTPVDTKVFMRPVLRPEQAKALLGRLTRIQPDGFENHRRNEMLEHYRTMLNSHSCEELVQLIKALHLRARQNIAQGRSPSTIEQDIKKRAEVLLYGELAVVLGSSMEEMEQQVGPIIEPEQAHAV